MLFPGTTLSYEKEIKSISSTLAVKIAKAGKRNIAVVDFTDLQGNVTELGRFLSEEFSVTLADTDKGFQVVDRTHLKTLLKEHKLSTTGLIDLTTAKKLGQIAGVDALITGTITPFGDSVRLSVKVLDTATARVIASSSGDIAKTKAIEELLGRGIESSSLVDPQSPPHSSASFIGSPLSKKVGNVMITVKKIAASTSQIDVFLEVANKSDRDLKLAINNDARPNLVDNQGNRFWYERGVATETAGYFPERHIGHPNLNIQSNNDVILHFRPEKHISQKGDLGSSFDLSLSLLLLDLKDKRVSTHQVSFSDIKFKK